MTWTSQSLNDINTAFRGANTPQCEPHYESEAKCKSFAYANCFVCKTNFHNKNFVLSLTFIMRLKATRKSIVYLCFFSHLICIFVTCLSFV